MRGARTFRYTRSTVIAAPVAAVAAEVNDLSRHERWSPFAAVDAKTTVAISAEPGVGQTYTFAGPRSGAGRLTIDAVAPERSLMTLAMTKPMKASHTVEFEFTPEPGGTRVTWTMFGEMNLVGRLLDLVIDCEKMCAGQFETGLAKLKTLVEGEGRAAA